MVPDAFDDIKMTKIIKNLLNITHTINLLYMGSKSECTNGKQNEIKITTDRTPRKMNFHIFNAYSRPLKKERHKMTLFSFETDCHEIIILLDLLKELFIEIWVTKYCSSKEVEFCSFVQLF